MARIRTLKPEFWCHEDLSALPEATHMLAAALLNYCDDFGYFNANPKLIQATVSPLREPSVSIPESLVRLSAIGYLRLGSGADGRQYGYVIHFEQHQRVAHPTASKISNLEIIWNPPETFRNPPETFAHERNREQGTGKGKEHVNVADATCAENFKTEFTETFWPEYPHKVSKGTALRAFVVARKKASLQTLMVGLERYIRARPPDRQWRNPATWLSGEGWLDEPAPVGGAPPRLPTKEAHFRQSVQQVIEEVDSANVEFGTGRRALRSSCCEHGAGELHAATPGHKNHVALADADAGWETEERFDADG